MKNGKNPYISIIVPVYNTEKYLEQCIESILTQTYNNFELILINDGSTDNSKKICEKYQEKDERVSLFNTSNNGVSSARNLGIEKCTGKYITFIDSDDYIERQTLELIINKVEDNDLLIIGEVKDFYKNDTLIKSKKENSLMKDLTIDNIRNNIKTIFSEIKMDSVHCKIYLNKIIKEKQLRFNEKVNIREDTLFNIQYLRYCCKLKSLNKELYHFRINEDIQYMAKRKVDINNCNALYDEFNLFKKYFGILDNHQNQIINKIIFNFYYEYLLYFYKIEKNSIMKNYLCVKELAQNEKFTFLINSYIPNSNFLKITVVLFRKKKYYLINLLFFIRFSLIK